MEKIEWNGEYYANFFEAKGEGPGGQKLRSWDDARKYGFLSAGGGRCYWHPLLLLSPGDRVWVNMPGCGFVGCCIVNASAAPAASVKSVERRSFRCRCPGNTAGQETVKKENTLSWLNG